MFFKLIFFTNFKTTFIQIYNLKRKPLKFKTKNIKHGH